MGWHWHEAPVLAVIDLFTVRQPISKENFIACLSQMAQDPRGPYGKVLLDSPHFSSATVAPKAVALKQKRTDVHKNDCGSTQFKSNHKTDNDLILLLKHLED